MGADRTKGEWRDWARAIDRSWASSAVAESLARWAPLRGTVLSYLPMSDEIHLGRIHELDRCRIAITRTPESGSLSVHVYEAAQLEQHRLGFDQPAESAPNVASDEIDVVLVPGLVFDTSGNRLGRGKGYYDELLSQLPAAAVRVGVTIDEMLVETIPTDAHDQRVAWVATESGVHRTGSLISAATQRFIAGAIPLGVAPDIHRFPEGTRTSADAAAAVGSELGEIAKSILFDVDGEPVLVIASGDRRINEGRLAAWAGGRSAEIARLSSVQNITGFVAGGTPAIGLSKSVKVVVDSDLARYRWVWSAGGTPDTVYPVALDRLVAASGARWVEVTDRGN